MLFSELFDKYKMENPDIDPGILRHFAFSESLENKMNNVQKTYNEKILDGGYELGEIKGLMEDFVPKKQIWIMNNIKNNYPKKRIVNNYKRDYMMDKGALNAVQDEIVKKDILNQSILAQVRTV